MWGWLALAKGLGSKLCFPAAVWRVGRVFFVLLEKVTCVDACGRTGGGLSWWAGPGPQPQRSFPQCMHVRMAWSDGRPEGERPGGFVCARRFVPQWLPRPCA